MAYSQEFFIQFVHTIGLEFKQIFKCDLESGLFVCLAEQYGRLYTVKIVSTKAEFLAERVRKEMAVTLFLREINHNMNIANIHSSDEADGFLWFVKDYITGKTLRDYDNDKKLPFFADRMGLMRGEFLSARESIVDGLSAIVASFQNLKSESPSLSNRYQQKFLNQEWTGLGELTGCDLSTTVKFYNNNIGTYLDEQNTCGSMGDLSLGNVVVDAGRVSLIDLEFFSFDNITMDAAYFWLSLHCHADWQKLWLERNLRDQNDMTMFRLSLIRILAGLLLGAKDYLIKSGEVKYLPDHIWSKYLVAAGESLQALTEI